MGNKANKNTTKCRPKETKTEILAEKRKISAILADTFENIVIYCKKKTMEQNILFLDIETAPMQGLVDGNDETMQHLWNEKIEKALANTDTEMSEEERVQQAGLYAEFGRIVCISFGMYYSDRSTGDERFCVTSLYGESEKQILENFAAMLTKKKMTVNKMCGHNAKEFDIPYIIRRMLILGIPLPSILQIADKKPWETPIIDTMEIWKCGAYRYAAQLKLLCAVFGIPTPKDDIDGSEVAGVFYKEKNYDRIATYCEKDVVATMQVYRKLNGQKLFDTEKITHLESKALV